MSALGQLLRLPQYVRNLARLRQVLGVFAKHGFGHVVERAGLDRYLSLGTRADLSDTAESLAQQTWETRVRLCLEALGPTFIKLGQMAATRPDLIPMSLIFELRKLQDDVPSYDFAHVEQTIVEDLGKPLLELYATFERAPLAAASIAQVHRATLHTGEEVVVKVQRPNLERIIHNDLELLMMVAAAVEERVPEVRAFRPADAIDQFARNLRRETDFDNELNNIERFRTNHAANPDLHLPVTYPQLSSKRLITMEFIDGCKVTDIAKLKAWEISGARIADIGITVTLASIFDHGFFHADPHPGNFFVLRDGRIALIDFGMMGTVDRDTTDDLLSFLVALLLGDPEMLVTQFIDLGLVDDTVNVRAMQGEISEIIRRYNGLSLKQVDIGIFISEVFEAVVRYRVRLPVELILMGKSISTMEGIAQDIHPDFNPVESLRPQLVRLYAARVLDPKNHSRKIYRVIHDYVGLARILPGEIRALLRRARQGELHLQHTDTGADLRAQRQERNVNRVVLALLSLTSWGLFTVVLPNAVHGQRFDVFWWYALVLGLQGLGSGALVTLSLLRSREI